MDCASLIFDVLLIVQLFIEIERLPSTYSTIYVKFVGFRAHLGYIVICLFVHIFSILFFIIFLFNMLQLHKTVYICNLFVNYNDKCFTLLQKLTYYFILGGLRYRHILLFCMVSTALIYCSVFALFSYTI